jgi:hypothetical protein
VRFARSAKVLRLWCDAQSSQTFVRSSGAPTVFQFDDVVDEHATLNATASVHLTTSTCFTSDTIAQRDPCRRRVERFRDLGRQGPPCADPPARRAAAALVIP